MFIFLRSTSLLRVCLCNVWSLICFFFSTAIEQSSSNQLFRRVIFIIPKTSVAALEMASETSANVIYYIRNLHRYEKINSLTCTQAYWYSFVDLNFNNKPLI